MATMHKKKMGEIMVEVGLITNEDLRSALELQERTGERLGKAFIKLGILDEKEIVSVLEYQLRIPFVELDYVILNPKLKDIISEEIARKYKVIPYEKDDNRIKLVMADPLDIFVIDDLRIKTGFNIEPYFGEEKAILNAIERYYTQNVFDRDGADASVARELGDILTELGWITDEQLSVANTMQNTYDLPLSVCLRRLGFITESSYSRLLREQYAIPTATTKDTLANPALKNIVPLGYALQKKILPISLMDGKITTAMANPLDKYIVSELRVRTGYAINPIYMSEDELMKAIIDFYLS